MKCEECDHESSEENAKHCSKCGEPYPVAAELPRIGVSSGRAKYMIAFPPVIAEFESKSDATEAARKAQCNGDSFESYSVELVHSLVPPETYPFVCSSCEEMFAETDQGRCGNCDKVKWIHRT